MSIFRFCPPPLSNKITSLLSLPLIQKEFFKGEKTTWQNDNNQKKSENDLDS